MKVKIDEKLICIPPYISATWDQVTFLQSEEDSETELYTLIIHIRDGEVVTIPGLDSSLVDIAFSAHMNHLESDSPEGMPPHTTSPSGEQKGTTFGEMLQQLTGMSPEQLSGMPIRFGVSGMLPGMEGIEMAFQHNQAQADSPDMPQEVLEKVAGMARMMGEEDMTGFPKPEPHCNCMHCQVARAVHGLEKQQDEKAQIEEVSEEDLQFRTWDIKQTGDKLYIVTNPLDSDEHYNVYLGTPVGCTCGQSDCEHLKAVLYS